MLRQTTSSKFLSLLLALTILLARPGCAEGAEAQESAKLVSEAKLLLDTYYGKAERLQRATDLLERAIAADRLNANAYVQAARLVAKGGHIVGNEYLTGTEQAYTALLDRALAIEPKNAKALLLYSEIYHFQKNYDRQVHYLDRAKLLDPSDPWLLVDYGDHYEGIGDLHVARSYYETALLRGKGNSPDQQNALMHALLKLARYKPLPGQPFRLRELALRAKQDRHPDDAWTLGNFADEFVFHGMFDDAIVFARQALGTLNYGAGRLTLAVALFGRAAQLTLNGQRRDAEPLLAEARQLGYSSPAILGRLEGSSPEVESLVPVIRSLLK